MRDTDKASPARPAVALRTRLGIFTAALALTALVLAPSALAAPFHPREEARDVTGLNHACGAAVDTKGDLYLSSAGTSEVKVYNPSHTLLTSIPDSHQPCSLAVTTTGDLYVSERGTGEVVRFKPNAYPFVGTPTYGAREVIDASGEAKGIAVDPFDNRLYVAEGSRVSVYEADGSFSGTHIGEGTLTEATGVAAYTYRTSGSGTDRYLWVADAAGLGADRLYLFGGSEFKTLKLRRELKGTSTPDGSFSFGAAGAYLAADPGNREAAGDKCSEQLGNQACTAGHLYLYDASHKALDEFDASGEYLDQTKNAAFADAEPTAVAIDRSGGAGDGTVYVTAGAGAGAKALAFGPLKAPSRKTMGEPISHVLAAAGAVATDSYGFVYAAANAKIHIYKPDGTEILTAGKAPLEDKGKAFGLAVDSTGKVYVLDENNGFSKEIEVTYYTPSAYPPVAGMTYTRHVPAVVTPGKFPEGEPLLKAIAVNPGPGTGKDHLFVTSLAVTQEYDSAANGSGLLNGKFAEGLNLGNRQSIAVNGQNGDVYIGGNNNAPLISVVSPDGKEVLARINEAGGPKGPGAFNPYGAVDSANGHVIEFDGTRSTAREYDAAGSFVAEFGNFTEGLVRDYAIAVDSACATHEPPLTGSACETYDPANGNVYVAFDDSNPIHPPYDVTAFGPLTYPAPVNHKLTVKREGTGSGKVESISPSSPKISCGTECEKEFVETEVVTLVATADPGSEFKGWTGCEAEPSATKCEVTTSKDREVVAEFKEKEGGTKYLLTVKKTGSGTVTSSPSGINCGSECEFKFGDNLKVTLEAKADKGFEFVGWGVEDCEAETVSATGGTCTVTMTEPKEVEAELSVEHPLLTVKKEGAGSGTVTSEPLGIIDCGATCSAKLNLHDSVVLTAIADPGSKFAGWGEGDCDAEPSETKCEVIMEEPREVTATFATLPQVIAKHPLPVLYDEATLRGEVDPSGLPTEYGFEYLTEDEYEANGKTFEGAHDTPVGELGATKGFATVSSPLLGLQEGTMYRFRLRAQNSVGSAEDEGTFETLQRRVSLPCANAAFRTGLSANLPDCRAYELVTPAETNGTGVFAPIGAVFNNWLTVPRGAHAGEAFSFETSATLPGFEGSGAIDGYRSERGAGAHPEEGWGVQLVSPSYVQGGGSGGGASAGGGSPDQLFSFWEVAPKYSLEGSLAGGEYLRTPTVFEVAARGSLGSDLAATSQFVSAGGTHVLFSSKAHLEPAAPPAGNVGLYDRAAGSASAHVLTLPPASASAEEEAEFFAALRSKSQSSLSGVSEDGASAVFKAGAALYVRLHDTNTVALSPRTAKVGDPLSCVAGPLLYEDQKQLAHEREFQWLRDATPILGASGGDITNSTIYTVIPADEEAALQCLTVAKESGTASVAISAPVEIAPLKAGQPPRPPAQIAAPTPPGPAAGTVETCDAGSWENAESLAYRWYVDGKAITGATSQAYEVQAADVPGTLQCVVSGTNAAATVASASGLTPTSPAPAKAAPVATAQTVPQTTYAGVSEDGRYVFFAFGNGSAPGRLFRFDTQSESATEIAAAGIFTLVSPDGSHAFFTSTEALTGGEENENGEHAEVGEHNLYAWDGADTHFIAILDPQDLTEFEGNPAFNLGVWTKTITADPGSGSAYSAARSTPNGQVFVFQSHAQLSTYGNEGVGEIYRYAPGASSGERLTCASCDPTGVEPGDDAVLDSPPFAAGTEQKSASGIDKKTVIPNVTDDGSEVFFQSPDRLLPEDANEALDVYEWRAKGSGDPECTRLSGCLALISSGQGEVPSFLYAMSADGHDVFFKTQEKLVGLDVAGSPSIYDAREEGGIPEPEVREPCQGDACQGQGSEPPVPPSPATTGAGEAGETPPSRTCAKGKHRVKGRCVPVKHHKRHRSRHAHANRGENR